jgi:Pectate lyase superfamily protein
MLPFASELSGLRSAKGRMVALGVALQAACGLFSNSLKANVGADTPWTTYEAEAMRTSGVVLGPRYDPYQVETESSGQKCVRLEARQFVEFTAAADANALVVRYSLPDAPGGGGTSSRIDLLINGKPIRSLEVTSRYSWLYGKYPFTNNPSDGKPRNFYDEVRVKGLAIAAGNVVRLAKGGSDALPCVINLVDLEAVPPPLAAPPTSISVLDFGAAGNGASDDTDALLRCMAAARSQGKTVWVPAGDYKLTHDIVVPSGTTIQGAGMWHTAFVGDPELYRDATRRVRFKLKGSDIHLADFSIMGKLNYRNDSEPNDGIVGAGCADSSVTRVWIEHTKTGTWIYNGSNLRITGCRYRNLLADGVNLCVGTYDTVVENCSTRGTGDDCFAIWPAASDQGFVGRSRKPGHNIIRHCTGQLPFLANGGAIYGGEDNSIEDCLFTDITAGCGILISTTFPTSDKALNIDNNFSGETVVQNCRLLRCGGFDHDWAWRGSLQVCPDHRSISGLTIRQVDIRDSFSDGISIVTPPNRDGHPSLSHTLIENVTVSGYGIGTSSRHGLFVGRDAAGGLELVDSKVGDIRNDSPSFFVQGN